MTILWRHTGCQWPWPLIFCRKSHKNHLFFIRFSKKVWKQQFWIFGMILFIWHILEKACVKLQKTNCSDIFNYCFLPYFQKNEFMHTKCIFLHIWRFSDEIGLFTISYWLSVTEHRRKWGKMQNVEKSSFAV